MLQIRGLHCKFHWTGIAVLTCLFVVQDAFPLPDIKCATGQWKVFNTINKNYTCRSCPTCPSEHGLSAECDTVVTQETVLECVKCVSGVNYSSDISLEQCQPCQSTTCYENEIVNGSCSPEEDTTACSGICENGYFMNRDKNGCVSLNNSVGAGDNITLNLTDVPHTTPSAKTNKLSGLSIALIIFVCSLICILGVAYCCYRQSHSRNKASENVELRVTDSSARTPSGDIKQDDEEMMALIPDENNGQLPSPNFGETSPSLNNNRQETASTDTDSGRIATTCTTAENEPVAVDNTHETPCLDVEPDTTARDENQPVCDTPCLDVEPDTTARDENQPVAVDNACGTPCLDVETGTTAEDENQPVAVDNTRETPCLDGETGTTAEDENLPTASPSLSTPNLSRRRRASPTTPNSLQIDDLNYKHYSNVCDKLNEKIINKDWKAVAGEMNYSAKLVKQFSEEKNPAHAFLQHWKTKNGNDVSKLISICTTIERDDVADILRLASGIPSPSGVEEENQ